MSRSCASTRETGGVAIERYVMAYDVGKAVNPKLVEGQIAGGFAQGVGGALYEEFLYDDSGEPLVRHFRRLSDADVARDSRVFRAAVRGRAEPAQSARAERRRRRRRQSGRRGDRLGHRRRASAPRRGDAIAGDAAADEAAYEPRADALCYGWKCGRYPSAVFSTRPAKGRPTWPGNTSAPLPAQ